MEPNGTQVTKYHVATIFTLVKRHSTCAVHINTAKVLDTSTTGRKVEFPAIGKVKYSYLTDHMSFTFPTSRQMSWW